MFTPPPSPQPPMTRKSSQESAGSTQGSEKGSIAQEEYLRSVEAKQRTARRFRQAVILIPLVIVGITICASYLSQTGFCGRAHAPSPSESSVQSWQELIQNPALWSLRKRQPQAQSSSTASSNPATTTAPVQNQPLPTVPSAPPVLPTPFPQAFDGNLQQNFSSASCLAFFTNMTQSAPFRSCRPFSLLLETSSTFLNAQTNLTLLNSLIWGTCNTSTAFGQCQANMNWFATNMKTACSSEIQARSAMVTGTIGALQAFSLMHDAACLEDPNSDSYCFVKAAQSTNPSDLYYYQLPLGTSLPTNSVASCSACSKSVMNLYATALQDPNQRSQLSGLAETYDQSARFSVQYCGSSFAATNVVSAASRFSTSILSLTAWAIWLGSVWTVLMVIS